MRAIVILYLATLIAWVSAQTSPDYQTADTTSGVSQSNNAGYDAAPAAPATNITYQPARCGPWFGGQACPPDRQNRQLFCSRWGYCGWEFQPQEEAGKFLHPDLLCTTDKECIDAIASSGVKDVVCSQADHKCMITIVISESPAPTPTVSGEPLKTPVAFVLGLMVALAAFL